MLNLNLENNDLINSNKLYETFPISILGSVISIVNYIMSIISHS